MKTFRNSAKYEDKIQRKCEKEAINFVVTEFFAKKNSMSKPPVCTVVWMAFIPYGYKCMITTEQPDLNLFFEVTKKSDGEFRCDCFKRIEYIVVPGKGNAVIFSDKKTKHPK